MTKGLVTMTIEWPVLLTSRSLHLAPSCNSFLPPVGHGGSLPSPVGSVGSLLSPVGGMAPILVQRTTTAHCNQQTSLIREWGWQPRGPSPLLA